MTELEKSLAEIAAANNLRTIQICYSAGAEYPGYCPEFFTATALWADADQELGLGCASAHASTLNEALENALQLAAARRTPVLADEAIKLGEAA